MVSTSFKAQIINVCAAWRDNNRKVHFAPQLMNIQISPAPNYETDFIEAMQLLRSAHACPDNLDRCSGTHNSIEYAIVRVTSLTSVSLAPTLSIPYTVPDFVSICDLYNDESRPSFKAITPGAVIELDLRLDYRMLESSIVPVLIADTILVQLGGAAWDSLNKELCHDA
ncbi:hypothetical protein K435DRAFT_877192 [Dendrothele bispora CBS 962.96]|uniref:Uncharacterized protein n=1 Tax=Dendrothele bispora (strain CBS 962.96) TaxID=1314807 RepID=A0A4V4HB45_DENBC|nr:hypothetical protein K435DRAFT_877192 [Dendrothele bispora CBS 962.96]